MRNKRAHTSKERQIQWRGKCSAQCAQLNMLLSPSACTPAVAFRALSPSEAGFQHCKRAEVPSGHRTPRGVLKLEGLALASSLVWTGSLPAVAMTKLHTKVLSASLPLLPGLAIAVAVVGVLLLQSGWTDPTRLSMISAEQDNLIRLATLKTQFAGA